MIATERLCLTSDRRRVVQHGHPESAFLLAAQGSTIPDIYLPLVQAFYDAKRKKPEPVQTKDPEPTPATQTADVVENYQTHVPKAIRRRGRPPRKASVPGEAHGFSGD